jgi:hypothetical protein
MTITSPGPDHGLTSNQLKELLKLEQTMRRMRLPLRKRIKEANKLRQLFRQCNAVRQKS